MVFLNKNFRISLNRLGGALLIFFVLGLPLGRFSIEAWGQVSNSENPSLPVRRDGALPFDGSDPAESMLEIQPPQPVEMETTAPIFTVPGGGTFPVILNTQTETLSPTTFDADAASQPSTVDEERMIDLLELKNMDMADVLKLVAQKTGLNIVAGNQIAGKVTIYLKDVKLKDALRIILDSNNLAYKLDNKILRIMPATEFEQRYGFKFGGNVQTRIIRLLHTDVADAVTLLNQVKSISGKIIADPKTGTVILVDSQEKIETMETLLKEIDVPLETKVFELTYASVKDVAAKVAEALTKNVGTLRFDEISKKLFIKDSPTKMLEVSHLIEAFDVKRREVLIEAKILQVDLSNTFKFGIDWEAIVRQYHDLTMVSNFNVLSAVDKKGKVTIGTLEDDDYTAMIEALETVGKTNILSNPRISALDNEEAKILVGTTKPYVTTTTTIPAGGNQTTAESVNFIDVGVKLAVTPTIHKDNFITMKIRPEVSSATKSITTSTNNEIPIKESSEAETTVMIKDGATIVIGGLIKEEKSNVVNKVPLLGDIPLLGYAFRNTSESVVKTEIVIFLTPRIITGMPPEDLTSEQTARQLQQEMRAVKQ